MNNKDESSPYRVLLITICSIVILTLCYFIPEYSLKNGISLKKIDLFQDLRKIKKPVLVKPKKEIKKEFVDSCPPNIICFEDYSEKKDYLNEFYESLSNKDSVTRICFFGDSFIDADIVTSEIRNDLQIYFGGSGVGFVPISSETNFYRRTIKHYFNGFNSHNIIHPGNKRSYLAAGGYVFTPLENNYLRYKGIKKSEKLSVFKNIRLFYKANKTFKINYKIDHRSSSFNTKENSKIETQVINNSITKNISFTFPPDEQLKLYGVSFEDNAGVVLDNFGMKSNSGSGLLAIPKNNWIEFNKQQDYKLIVLQYGLNVLNKNTTNLNRYVKRMTSLVKRIQKQCPNAKILLLGMPDRGVKIKGEITTMPNIFLMINAQRTIAKNTGIVFWDVFSAMGGVNSMKEWAERKPPLANKDYTHLKFKGGNKLGSIFSKSLIFQYEKYLKKKDWIKKNNKQ